MISINGKNCDDLKIVFSELPSIPKPIRRLEEKVVSGKNGVLTIDKGTYDNIPLMLTGHAECTRTELIDYFGLFGELKLETSKDRFWKYRVVNLDIKEIIGDGILIQFIITLSLDPFKYLDVGKNKINGTSMNLVNKYNTDAFPIIKIKGSGNISISKNMVQVLSIQNVSDYVVVDCLADVIHRNNVSYDSRTTGNTFCLDANKTTILTFNGNITGVELIPNWREL